MAGASKQRTVIGDARRWKALAHPLRGAMLDHLERHGPANSTRIATALGENTGTTSYHLRVLAEAGVIDEVPEKAKGRERWWRTVPTEHREPDYDSLPAHERAALDAWRARQLPGERDLFERFLREYRSHGPWAKAARVSTCLTEAGLQAVFDGFLELVREHGYTRDEAPPDACPVQLRMFHLPEHAPHEPDGDGNHADLG